MLFPYEKDPNKIFDSRPKCVAIVCLGKSKKVFANAMQDYRHFNSFPNEVWAMNSGSIIYRSHKLFIADGFTHQYKKDSAHTSLYAEWMKQYDQPVIVTEPDPEWPMTVAYPLQEVIDSTRMTGFGNTLSYMIAYACHLKLTTGCIEKLDVFGADFTYTDQKTGQQVLGEHGHEKAAKWAGYAMGIGIDVRIAAGSEFAGGTGYEFYGFKQALPNVKLPDGTWTVGDPNG